MRKITVLDFANQIGVLSDEVPVVVKTDRKVIGRFRCLYEIPETACWVPSLFSSIFVTSLQSVPKRPYGCLP